MWYPFNLEIAVMRDQTKLYYHEKYNAFFCVTTVSIAPCSINLKSEPYVVKGLNYP